MSSEPRPPKHATASVHLFHESEAGWQTGLVLHPRHGRWMLPGGHVEDDENPAEAALREVREETGLAAVLVLTPGLADPPAAAARLVHPPAWIVEYDVPAEPRLPRPHVHVDHLYLATTTDAAPAGSELPFRWYAEHELDGLHMFDDTRARAKALFTLMAVAIRSRPPVGSFRL